MHGVALFRVVIRGTLPAALVTLLHHASHGLQPNDGCAAESKSGARAKRGIGKSTHIIQALGKKYCTSQGEAGREPWMPE